MFCEGHGSLSLPWRARYPLWSPYAAHLFINSPLTKHSANDPHRAHLLHAVTTLTDRVISTLSTHFPVFISEHCASVPPGNPEPVSVLLFCALSAAQEGSATHVPPQKATFLLTAPLKHTQSPGEDAQYDTLSFSLPSSQPRASGCHFSVSAVLGPWHLSLCSPPGPALGLSSPSLCPYSISAEAVDPHWGSCGRAVSPTLSSDRSMVHLWLAA